MDLGAVASYDESVLDTAGIVQAVEKAGYGAIPKASAQNKSRTTTPAAKPEVSTAQAEYKQMKQRLLLSALFTIPLFYISMGHMMGWPLPSSLLGMENAISFAFTQFLLLIPVVFINFKYYRMGFKTLFHGSPNMDSLIAIGSSAAIVYGIYAIYKIGIGFGHGDMATVHSFMMDLYFESAGMILTLITLGKTLEARAKGKTSDAITKLMNLAPKTATVERDGKELQVPVEEVQLGETLIVKAGESVPVDGIVIEGFSSVDESALTGESIPVEKHIGDKVIGATTSKSGYFKMQATKVGDDTTLAQIVRLVDEATSSKAKHQANTERDSAPMYEQTTIKQERKGAIHMEKVLNIEGMVCGMCVKHVDKALRDIQGIKDVDVSLESKSAQVQLDQDVPDAVLKAAIEDAGYQLVSIQ